MKLKALFPWQQFNWYLTEINIEDVTEDLDYFYGRPVGLKCCWNHNDKNPYKKILGELAWPKYAWTPFES